MMTFYHVEAAASGWQWTRQTATPWYGIEGKCRKNSAENTDAKKEQDYCKMQTTVSKTPIRVVKNKPHLARLNTGRIWYIFK